MTTSSMEGCPSFSATQLTTRWMRPTPEHSNITNAGTPSHSIPEILTAGELELTFAVEKETNGKSVRSRIHPVHPGIYGQRGREVQLYVLAARRAYIELCGESLDASEASLGAIVGSVVGGVAFVMVVAFTVFFSVLTQKRSGTFLPTNRSYWQLEKRN
ncbi:uncharacterized protein LAESUDRAFT_726953 [Laetiporus sulphureus 93-53]|uniref:Uncharacterized protein n=1 Tax=Laetiporus sulphureus 93-53 TaxID=1314785 RepID=A0A165DUP6_9APHY|nr:uncharacterized protein LAESUDRAFT_726953 [Laetiporus sulphureus 93-53]KZT05665.1 hypothetical protein LAESUDRAFT_726953 [Laetiporus sulphureus 93-53]